MPKRLAITGPYEVEVMEYEESALEPNQVRIRTEYASGKRGTTTEMFDGSVFRGQRFDQEMRMFVPEEPKPSSGPSKPGGSGTSGVGLITEIGSAVAKATMLTITTSSATFPPTCAPRSKTTCQASDVE